jgi:hypothetical protein
MFPSIREQAILDGQLRSDEVTVVDSRTGEMISLDSAMKKGLFDRKTGKVKDSRTGDRISNFTGMSINKMLSQCCFQRHPGS